jgi:DNA polymerase-3 subunit gamma/tau
MSLDLIYRPSSFSEVRGNEDLINSLSSLVENPKKRPHSYLFHGPSGCGKTTIARILANEFDCQGSDFVEINAAEMRGIDTVREINSNTRYKPMYGSCRVWVIDECHKMTNDAQNSFLKVAEEAPEHCYFIFCTTDPQKVITTLKNRCSIYQVKLLDEEQIFSLVRAVARKEGCKPAKEVLEQIAKSSQGHPRNAVKILEQVIQLEPERQLEAAKRMIEEDSQIKDLAKALMNPNIKWAHVSTILQGLKGQDAETIRRSVLGYVSAVIVNGKQPDPRLGMILEEFLENTYDSGFPRIVYACFSIVTNS